MSSHSRELVFLILQFLEEEKFTESVHKLEHESGFFFNMKYFEEKVHAGEWEEVEKYLSGFTNVDDNRYSMKIFFEIRKQKCMEALDWQDKAKAVDILVNELKVFSTFNEELYKEITQLSTLGNFRENEQLSKYGDTKTGRSIMLIELKKLIEANPLFLEKLAFPTLKLSRLRTLINQSLNWQHQLCKNPRPNPDIKTLFTDHTCTPPNGALAPTLVNLPPAAKPTAYTSLGVHGVGNIPEATPKTKQEVEAEFFGEDQNWGHVESSPPIQPQNRYSEPDNRDWRGRSAQFPASGKGRSWENKEFGGRFDSRQQKAGQHNRQDQLNSQFSRAQRVGPAPALIKAEVPWSARRGTLSDKDRVLKTVKGILNKPTPEKFYLLKGQLIYSGITKADILKIIMGRKRKPDHPRRMMSDVLHNRTSVAPPLEEASHRPASEGPLVPPASEGPLPPYRPPSVAPQQLPCTRPPRLPSVRPPSMAPQQLSSSAYEPSADPSTSSQPTSGHVSSSSTSTRRGRGCAKGIKEWGTGKKLHIQFDGNYCPIGDNVAKLTTQLGIIVRNGNIVPLTFVDWNSVPDDIVDAIWKDVKDNLNICPEEYKPICMKNCNSIWKDHKNKLKAKYFKPRSSDPNLKDDVPMNVVPSQWEQLVEYWRTSDAEKIASRNAKNRRAHGIAHTTGRTTFSQIRHEMTSKGESTDKMNVWLMTRRVDDPEVIQTLDEFKRQLSMLPEDGRTLEARNAIFHELIGHDRHGYCRTYGRIVPRRVVYKDGAGPSQSTPHPSTIDQITQQVRAELRDELREELRAEFSTHLQQMRAEMMALVSQGASVDPNRQVPDASSGHRAFRESAEDENPYTPPPEDQIFPE